jgi:hypothetical protein
MYTYMIKKRVMMLQLRVDCGEYICSYVGEDDENKYQFHEMMMMMIVRFRLLSKVNNLLIFQ